MDISGCVGIPESFEVLCWRKKMNWNDRVRQEILHIIKEGRNMQDLSHLS
jgi:hypothetical protein